MAVRNLECAVCGNSAGRWQQHWNRDTGFGICWRCVTWLRSTGKYDEQDIADLYGKEGVNFGPPQ